MAFGDYSGPDKPDKGHEGGSCNRQRCQASPANYYNHGSHSWYCGDCADAIGGDVVNARSWPIDFPRLFPNRPFHEMFETRAQLDAREAAPVVEPRRPPSPRDIVALYGVPRKSNSRSLARLLGKAKR